MIRVLIQGQGPKMVRHFNSMTAADAIRAAGGDPNAAGTGLSVGGRQAHSSAPVKANTTVALQPMAKNG